MARKWQKHCASVLNRISKIPDFDTLLSHNLATNDSRLLNNSCHQTRRAGLPASIAKSCLPVKWWTMPTLRDFVNKPE